MQFTLHALPLHPPKHPDKHEPEHEPVHEPVHAEYVQPAGAASAFTNGILERTTAPTTGNAVFAAFLKNSLRDWSSSFCFLLDIKLKFLLHRNSQLCGLLLIVEAYKKSVESDYCRSTI